MSYEFIALLILGAATGGFINGLAGFGTALFSLGFWLQIMPTWQAVAIVAMMSVASGVQSLWMIRADLKPGLSKLPRFLLPAIVGLPAGAAVLEFINGQTLKLVIAGFMLLYGAFFTLRRSLPQVIRPMPVVDSLIGLSGGFLGGAASLSGPLPTMWCAMQPWTKAETSAVLRPYNVVILAIAVIIFARNGYYSRETLIMMAIALPVTLISSKLGITVFRLLNDNQFRSMVIWLMFISGALLVVNQLAQS
ncbi:sulfite exporter TauE/SafE family protein [Pseudomonas putida]